MRFWVLKQGRIMVIIKYNNSNLGKRYVLLRYYQWELRETTPYDALDWVRLRGFRLRELK